MLKPAASHPNSKRYLLPLWRDVTKPQTGCCYYLVLEFLKARTRQGPARLHESSLNFQCCPFQIHSLLLLLILRRHKQHPASLKTTNPPPPYSANTILAVAFQISTGKPCPSVVHFQQVRAKRLLCPTLDYIGTGLECGLSRRWSKRSGTDPKMESS